MFFVQKYDILILLVTKSNFLNKYGFYSNSVTSVAFLTEGHVLFMQGCQLSRTGLESTKVLDIGQSAEDPIKKKIKNIKFLIFEL